jgi:acyl-CoA thioesterase
MSEAGPFESVLRKGVQVSTKQVSRLQDGKLVGTTVARYAVSGPDTVRRLRFEGTRKP